MTRKKLPLLNKIEITDIGSRGKAIARVDNFVTFVDNALPGDVVLDCFAGGGPIFPAATKNNCRAIGAEINPKYHAIAKLRMDEKI